MKPETRKVTGNANTIMQTSSADCMVLKTVIHDRNDENALMALNGPSRSIGLYLKQQGLR